MCITNFKCTFEMYVHLKWTFKMSILTVHLKWTFKIDIYNVDYKCTFQMSI